MFGDQPIAGALSGENAFRISWPGGSLRYHPRSGHIQDMLSGRVVTMERAASGPFSTHADGASATPSERFKPVCLTIFSGHRCNLACAYCYIPEKDLLPAKRIAPASLRAAAAYVAARCANQNRPLMVGFHGGNEPLLNPTFIEECLAVCSQEALRHGLELRAFCTTNGVVPEQTARWAARTFHGITLSWDGPPDVHDRARPLLNGSPTSSIVRRSAHLFLNAVEQFKVRATITGDAAPRLLETVQYFHRRGIEHVECYPAYQNRARPLPPELIPKASDFVTNFLKARKWATRHGLTLGYAGSRPDALHDRFCPIFQHNLTVTPDGYLTACFQATHNHEPRNAPYLYGRLHPEHARLTIDPDRLNALFSTLARPYPPCATCFNALHCAKNCPTVCPMQAHPDAPFDCTIEKWIGLANLLEAAGHEITDDELEQGYAFFSRIAVEPLSDTYCYVEVSRYHRPVHPPL